MNILWHMPTLKSHGCGLSNRARHLAEQLARHSHSISFTVDTAKTDLGDAFGPFPLKLLNTQVCAPIHWSLQSRARSRSAAHLLNQLNIDHELFISCQPEMISAYVSANPPRPNIFVCGGTNLLHEVAERNDQKAYSLFARSGCAIDRVLRRRAEVDGFRSASAVVFDSHQTRESVIQKYSLDARRAITIHGGVDPERFRPATPQQRSTARLALGIAERELLIIWTGRLSPEKNLPLLIDALADLEHTDMKCILIGDGSQRAELKARAHQLGLNAHVMFAGLQADVLPYLHAADIFAFPSRGESFGCALAEAMSCALPCIALQPDGQTIRNASTELIEHGVSGLLVVQPDGRSLAAAIKTLADDSAFRAFLGREARHRVQNLCSWDSAGDKLNGLIQDLTRARIPNAKFRRPSRSTKLIRPGA